MSFKLTDKHRAMIAERRAAGLSLRAIAAWLEVTEGVSVTAEAVRKAIERDGGPQLPGGPPKPTPPPPEPSPRPERAERAVGDVEDPAEGDAADYRLLTTIIEDLDGDIEKARERGNVQGHALLERLRADLLKRRRELRPPAPPAELDAELLDAGRRAAEKLHELVHAELAKVVSS